MRVPGLAFGAVFDVPSDGSRDLELRIPAPANVVITVVDHAGGTGLAGVQLQALLEDGAFEEGTCEPIVVAHTDATGSARLLLPSGAFTFGVGRPGSGATLYRSSRAVLVPGEQSLELVAEPCASLRVRLRDGAAIIPWEATFALAAEGQDGSVVQVEAADVPRFSEGGGESGPAAELRLGAAGPVRLVIYDVPGYLPSEPVDVVLSPGETAAVEIMLRRRN